MRDSVNQLSADLKYALRQFARHPKFWSIVVATLVVGIAASTTIYAVVDGVLLKPLPYPESERLVRIGNFNLRGEYHYTNERITSLDVAAYYPAPREVTLTVDGQPARLPAAGITSDLFDVLGVQPALGRGFLPEEMRPGGPGIVGGTYWRSYGVVILSAGAWQNLYSGSADVVGSVMSIEGLPHTIVGVMPPDFRFPDSDIALWFPHNIDPDDLWGGNVAAMIGRLKDGVSIEAAQEEVRAVMASFRELIPWAASFEEYGQTATLTPLIDDVVGSASSTLIALLSAIGVVLLVVCVNVANLLLARGIGRERELATRAALGADRGRLVRQLLTENVVIAFVSGIAGILLASLLLSALIGFLPGDLPRVDEIAIDARVLAFALVVTTLTAAAFGLLPAVRATSSGSGFPRATGGVIFTSRERRLANGLASIQLALAVVLVIGAVLLMQSLANLNSVETGFRTENLVTATVAPPGFIEFEPERQHAFARQLRERLNQTPGIESAALATGSPFDVGLFGTSFALENPVDGLPPENDNRLTAFISASEGYFETMGIPLIDGRVFDAGDRSDSQKVVIVNRSMARKHWGDRSPIGARLLFHYDDQPGMVDGVAPWFTVVGVVEDIRFYSLDQGPTPMIVIPLAQSWTVDSLRIAARGDLTAGISPTLLQDVAASIDSGTPVTDVQSFALRIGGSIARPRFAGYLLAVFSMVALFLASVGVYGVLSYAVSTRVPEIGVRMALGADNTRVFASLLSQGVKLSVFGLVVGIPLAIFASRLLSGLLFGVSPLSPVLLAGVISCLVLVGACAAYLPARRAMRIDPMQALKSE